MKIGVEYLRYSSERQTEQSIEGQMRVCDEYAKRNDIMIVERYIDRAMSGTNDNRTDFQRMIKDSNNKSFDVVLVYKLDRFSRNKYEMAIHRKTLRDNGVKLISATENIPDTPEGIILESLLEGMAEYYSAELSQKIRRGFNECRLKGNFTGGIIEYGYCVTGNKLEGKKVKINENESKILKRIFEQYASGIIVTDIISALNKEGITHRGKTFKKTTVLKMLHNEKYTGRYVVNGKEYTNMYPRIIPDELFNRVKKISDDNKHGKNSVIHPYLLRKKVICGYCGHFMIGDSGTSRTGERKNYYNCTYKKFQHKCKKSSVKKDVLEKLVLDTTLKVLSKHHIISDIADALLSRQAKNLNDNSAVKQLLKSKETTEKSINNILSAIEQGIITASTKSRLEELETNLKNIECQIKLTESTKKKELTKDKLIYYIKNCLLKKPKHIIELLVDKIILYDDKMEITYKLNNGSPDNTDRDFLFYTENIDSTIISLQYQTAEKSFKIELYC